MRLYAIGDVHGCDALLAEAHRKIADDLAAYPPYDFRVIHCGDYVDRGRDSAAVVERLANLTRSDPRVVCLLGNHEQMMLGFLDDPPRFGQLWLANGADATLLDYGIATGPWFMAGGTVRTLAADFARRVPAHHDAFLRRLAHSATFGDYFFVHAGINPEIPLGEQSLEDLTWIREEFLEDDGDFGVVVVHGHTPVEEPEVRLNRIDIDTGAVFSGRLTCLVLEGTGYRFL
jgi:serine/threonine protein phosphatase 1